MKIRLRTLAVAAIVLAMLGVAAAALLVWRGVYDISALEQHTRPVFLLLDYALQRSVRTRADEKPPGDLAQARRVLAGAAQYKDHCSQCHGAPGVSPDAFAFGLRPAPANLIEAGRSWHPAEIFWVVKNGIKMTGMPAWAYRLTDDEIWDVVAFLRAMPRLSPRQYAELAGTAFPAPAPEPREAVSQPAALRPGDAKAGREATAQYLCATCHVIPGLVSARHHVGPPLDGMGTRAFIGGVLPNTRENMVRWLKNPQEVDPLSAMPPLGLSDQDARDIAAFLSTLDKVRK